MAINFASPGNIRHLANETATLAAGKECAKGLGASAVVALVGDLGAGKTSFSKGLAAGLGYAGDVSSPTFTLVHEYVGGRVPVYHFDFYRLENVDQLWDIGWDEYLSGEGLIIAEWADKFPDALPSDTIWIALSHAAANEVKGGRYLKILAAAPDSIE